MFYLSNLSQSMCHIELYHNPFRPLGPSPILHNRHPFDKKLFAHLLVPYLYYHFTNHISIDKQESKPVNKQTKKRKEKKSSFMNNYRLFFKCCYFFFTTKSDVNHLFLFLSLVLVEKIEPNPNRFPDGTFRIGLTRTPFP